MQTDMFSTPSKRAHDFLLGEDGNTLTAWVKILGVLGACLYATGTVVANGALANLGTSEFTWPPPQAVLTGSWCAMILVFAMCPGVLFYSVITSSKSAVVRFGGGVSVLFVISLVVAVFGSELYRIREMPTTYTVSSEACSS